MRDKRFIAEHRGGPLKKEQHRQLIKWACDCAENVLPLFGEKLDERLKNALLIAKEWAKGKATVGDARNASLKAIAVANESSNPVAIAVARAVGHAVATQAKFLVGCRDHRKQYNFYISHVSDSFIFTNFRNL